MEFARELIVEGSDGAKHIPLKIPLSMWEIRDAFARQGHNASLIVLSPNGEARVVLGRPIYPRSIPMLNLK